MAKIVFACSNKIDVATITVAEWRSVMPGADQPRESRTMRQIAHDLLKRYPVITAYLAKH